MFLPLLKTTLKVVPSATTNVSHEGDVTSVWAIDQSVGVVMSPELKFLMRLMAATNFCWVGDGPTARSPATNSAALSQPSIATSLYVYPGSYLFMTEM